MENLKKPSNEKPKGNMLQNDNREDEADADNLQEDLKNIRAQVPIQNDSHQTHKDSKNETKNEGD